MMKQNVRSGQGGMTAKIHFRFRREPSNSVRSVVHNVECGLGEIVLSSYTLHDRVGQPFGAYRTDRSRVAGENSVCEGIYLIDIELHSFPFFRQSQSGVCTLFNPQLFFPGLDFDDITLGVAEIDKSEQSDILDHSLGYFSQQPGTMMYGSL